MNISKNDYLQKVLDTHDLSKVASLQTFVDKKNKVKDALSEHFSEERASKPIDSGSYAKNTAIIAALSK